MPSRSENAKNFTPSHVTILASCPSKLSHFCNFTHTQIVVVISLDWVTRSTVRFHRSRTITTAIFSEHARWERSSVQCYPAMYLIGLDCSSVPVSAVPLSHSIARRLRPALLITQYNTRLSCDYKKHWAGNVSMLSSGNDEHSRLGSLSR